MCDSDCNKFQLQIEGLVCVHFKATASFACGLFERENVGYENRQCTSLVCVETLLVRAGKHRTGVINAWSTRPECFLSKFTAARANKNEILLPSSA
jgi:hypothetical protein